MLPEQNEKAGQYCFVATGFPCRKFAWENPKREKKVYKTHTKKAKLQVP